MEISLKRQLASVAIGIILMGSILIPSIIKLRHALVDHFQEECTNQGIAHFHKVEFDCDFHKYPISYQFYPPFVDYAIRSSVQAHENTPRHYNFVGENTKLSFSLRAPPAL